MAFNELLADRVRIYLEDVSNIKIEEKRMFSGLAFLVNGKMCVNVSGDNLMCRIDPKIINEVAERNGYQPMIMRGKQLRGYCYVNEDGYKSTSAFNYWMDLCLSFNGKAKASKKKTSTKKTRP